MNTCASGKAWQHVSHRPILYKDLCLFSNIVCMHTYMHTYILYIHTYMYTFDYCSTADLEAFQNHMLMYASKRYAFCRPVCEARVLPAALDYHHTTGTDQTTNTAEGDVHFTLQVFPFTVQAPIYFYNQCFVCYAIFIYVCQWL